MNKEPLKLLVRVWDEEAAKIRCQDDVEDAAVAYKLEQCAEALQHVIDNAYPENATAEYITSLQESNKELRDALTRITKLLHNHTDLHPHVRYAWLDAKDVLK